MEKRISKLEDRNLEVIQVREERKLRSQKMTKFYKNYWTLLGRETLGKWISQKKKGWGEKGAESLFKEIIALLIRLIEILYPCHEEKEYVNVNFSVNKEKGEIT